MKNTEKRKKVYDYLKTDYNEELSEQELIKCLRKKINNGKINGIVHMQDNTVKGALLLAELAENIYSETRREVQQKDRIIKHKQNRLKAIHQEKLHDKKEAFKKNASPKIHLLFYIFAGVSILASLLYSGTELIRKIGSGDFGKLAAGAVIIFFIIIFAYIIPAILRSQLKKGLADKVCSHEFSSELATKSEEFTDKGSTEYIEKQLNKGEGCIYFLKKKLFSLYNYATFSQLNDIFTEKLMSENIIRPVYKKANTRKFRLYSFEEDKSIISK